MAEITIGGNPINTLGLLPKVGQEAPNFKLAQQDLSRTELKDYKGTRLILNIFPSIDTNICANSVRQFNEQAAELENTKVLCISKDLPFAQKRFCGAENIENVETLSDFVDGNFGKTYQVDMTDGPLKDLHSRAVVIIDENGKVVYTEQVPEIAQEPDYDAALQVLK